MTDVLLQDLSALPLHELKKQCWRKLPFPTTKKEAITRIVTQHLLPKVMQKIDEIELHDKGGLVSRRIIEVIEHICDTEIKVPIAPPERKRLRKPKHKKVSVQILDSDEES